VLAGKDGVLDDPAFGGELLPTLSREGEVGGVVAMEVAGLAVAEAEAELAASSGAGLDPVPAMSQLLTISETARRSGVASTALRYYEERGRRDWSRLSATWRGRIDERIIELERLKEGLTECIGCGCLSLDRCKLANPDDRAARFGSGPRYWLGAPRPAQAPTAGKG
jgi:hypothetical protein